VNLWWACRVGLDAQRTPSTPPYDPEEFTALRLRCCLPTLPRAHICWLATQAALLICDYSPLRLVEQQEWSKPTTPAVIERVQDVYETSRLRLPATDAIVMTAWSAVVLGAVSPVLGDEEPMLNAEIMTGMIGSIVLSHKSISRLLWPLYETALRTAYYSLPPHVVPPKKASHHRDLIDVYCQLPGKRGKRTGADWLIQRAMSIGWTADEMAGYINVPVDRIYAAIHLGRQDENLAVAVAPCAVRVPPSLVYPIVEASRTWAMLLRRLGHVSVERPAAPWLGKLDQEDDDDPDV
jgi:hypothetical protein